MWPQLPSRVYLGPCGELTVKSVRKPDAANRHARFDERGWKTGRLHSVPPPILPSTPLIQHPSSRLGASAYGLIIYSSWCKIVCSALESIILGFCDGYA